MCGQMTAHCGSPPCPAHSPTTRACAAVAVDGASSSCQAHVVHADTDCLRAHDDHHRSCQEGGGGGGRVGGSSSSNSSSSSSCFPHLHEQPQERDFWHVCEVSAELTPIPSGSLVCSSSLAPQRRCSRDARRDHQPPLSPSGSSNSCSSAPRRRANSSRQRRIQHLFSGFGAALVVCYSALLLASLLPLTTSLSDSNHGLKQQQQQHVTDQSSSTQAPWRRALQHIQEDMIGGPHRTPALTSRHLLGAGGGAGSGERRMRRTARIGHGVFGTSSNGGGIGGEEEGDGAGSAIPSLSIFCAPKPYTDDPADPQRRALLSWLRLTPSPKIVLLGDDPSFYALSQEFPQQIEVEPEIDYNFYGVPMFSSMLARAQAAATDLSMIINGDIILLNDVMLALQKVLHNFDHWVLTAARWDVAQDFPYNFDAATLARSGKSRAALEKEIREYVRAVGSLHTYGGVDFWMWNNSPVPLFEGVMPPFAFGRGKYDNWLTHEIVSAGLRHMVDASDAITSIHVAHSYAHVADAAGAGNGEAGRSFWSTRKQTSWELYANIHLSMTYGSYSNQKGTALHVPWRIASCYEPQANFMCLQRRIRPGNCSCEYSPFVPASQSDPKTDGRFWLCGSVSIDNRDDFAIDPVPSPTSKAGLPHTMEQLLPQVARHVGGEKVVILVAVTYGYAEMLMSFVCRLRMLGLADNLVVAALDEDLYRFSFTQGLAVYYEQVSTGLKGVDSADCAFGSQCFRQFTKLKSRAVLRVLKAGYSVLWTDVDIVWYKDPLRHLMSFGPGTFPIQSNEPNASLPGTGIRRINSGFYFARADEMTVEAFEAITAHAATTKLSEQPSFYDILCGVHGELLVPGKEECVWRNGLRTIFLDRALYPNGAVHEFWEAKDVTAACEAKGCAILHNNWISGKDAKRQRLVANGYWHYDAERRLCVWPWHSRLHPVLQPTPADADGSANGGGGSTQVA